MKAKTFADALIHQVICPMSPVLWSIWRVALINRKKGIIPTLRIIMGLAGNQPEDVDIDAIPAFMKEVAAQGRLPMDQESSQR